MLPVPVLFKLVLELSAIVRLYSTKSGCFFFLIQSLLTSIVNETQNIFSPLKSHFTFQEILFFHLDNVPANIPWFGYHQVGSFPWSLPWQNTICWCAEFDIRLVLSNSIQEHWVRKRWKEIYFSAFIEWFDVLFFPRDETVTKQVERHYIAETFCSGLGNVNKTACPGNFHLCWARNVGLVRGLGERCLPKAKVLIQKLPVSKKVLINSVYSSIRCLLCARHGSWHW